MTWLKPRSVFAGTGGIGPPWSAASTTSSTPSMLRKPRREAQNVTSVPPSTDSPITAMLMPRSGRETP